MIVPIRLGAAGGARLGARLAALIVPPPVAACCSAAAVQLPGVPFPTTAVASYTLQLVSGQGQP